MFCALGFFLKMGGIVSPFLSYIAIGDAAPGTNSRGSLTFTSSGTVQYVGYVGSTIVGSPNWYLPTTTGIGSSYWIRFTPTTGTATANSAATWAPLSSTQAISKGPTTSVGGTCTFTVEIATDSLGSNIVLTSTDNVVGYQHTL
jgi:hypothetical protein